MLEPANDNGSGQKLLSSSDDPELVRRMLFTVNAVLCEHGMGWVRKLNPSGSWEWHETVEGGEPRVHSEPPNLVDSGHVETLTRALVDQNPGSVLWASYGQAHGGWEVTLHMGELKVSHVAGTPLGLMFGLVVCQAIGVSPQAELQKLFPIPLS